MYLRRLCIPLLLVSTAGQTIEACGSSPTSPEEPVVVHAQRLNASFYDFVMPQGSFQVELDSRETQPFVQEALKHGLLLQGRLNRARIVSSHLSKYMLDRQVDEAQWGSVKLDDRGLIETARLALGDHVWHMSRNENDTLLAVHHLTPSTNMSPSHRLFKRQQGESNPNRVCEIAIVLDHRAVKLLNGPSKASEFILSLLHDASVIFSNSFSVSFKPGYLYAMTEPMGDLSPENPHTDMLNQLNAFSMEIKNGGQQFPGYAERYNDSKPCLHHMVTATNYGGMLGLAWVGGKPQSQDGVCGRFGRNAGITTLLDGPLRTPFHKSVATLTHELAHNFGADHDDSLTAQETVDPNDTEEDIAQCRSGGFVMSSIIRSSVNEFTFSQCSEKDIQRTIATQGHCLVPQNDFSVASDERPLLIDSDGNIFAIRSSAHDLITSAISLTVGVVLVAGLCVGF